MPFVYMLRCADGSYYVGSTRSLELRIFQHNSDKDGCAYTRSRRPVTLVWHAEVENVGQAFGLEKQTWLGPQEARGADQRRLRAAPGFVLPPRRQAASRAVRRARPRALGG